MASTLTKTAKLSEESAPQFTRGPLKVVMDGTLTGIWASVCEECVDPVTGKPWDRELLRSETTHVRREEAYEGSWEDFAEAPEQYELTEDGAEAIANANLWAAAPALYEANRLTIEALNSEYRIPANADDDWLYDTLGSALSGAYFAARAALSSARGEQGK